jgi:hypothetical protein
MRSEARKRRVSESTSYRSRTFPSAILGSEERDVDVTTVSSAILTLQLSSGDDSEELGG